MPPWLLSFFSSFTAVFAIVDPFALIPIFLTLTERLPDKARNQVCRKASIVAMGVLLCFAFLGERIFHLFGISLAAFRIAGGILLLLLGIQELGANRQRVKEEEEVESMERDDISIFPLATPLLAGPGSISTVVLQGSTNPDWPHKMLFILAIILVCFASYLVLRSAPYLYRVMGKTGLNLLTRIMGIILTAIAVQYIIDGLSTVWQQLRNS